MTSKLFRWSLGPFMTLSFIYYFPTFVPPKTTSLHRAKVPLEKPFEDSGKGLISPVKYIKYIKVPPLPVAALHCFVLCGDEPLMG